jgi:hypothetical protein
VNPVPPNDEVERRGDSPASNEGSLSRSSTPSSAQRRRGPRSLEPIVRGFCVDTTLSPVDPESKRPVMNIRSLVARAPFEAGKCPTGYFVKKS